MIDLSQPTEPYDLDLPYGPRVTVKPLTTAGMAAAQAAARRAVEAIERQANERRKVALKMATAGGDDVAGLAELLSAAEAGMVEAVPSERQGE